MSRNRSKIFDEIFLFFLFPHLPFSSHPREWTFVYILFFFSFGPKTFPIPPFQQWISPRLVKIFYLILIISGRGGRVREFWRIFYPRSRLDCAPRMCNRNSSRLDNNFDPSTIMLKNSCYVFHTVSFDPRRNGAPRNSSKRTFKLHNTTLNSFLILLYGQKRVPLPLLLSFFLFSRELSSLSLPKLKLFRTILTKYKNKIQTDPLCSTDDLYPISNYYNSI